MRPIDADAFLVNQMRVVRANETEWQTAYWTGVDDTLGDIADAPTIEAELVIHSKWEITDIDHAHGHKCYHCPECGEDEWRYDETNYCPNCGARMDGE